jgi:hypothetical protein
MLKLEEMGHLELRLNVMKQFYLNFKSIWKHGPKRFFFSDKLYGTIISLSEMITTRCEIFGKFELFFLGIFCLRM